MNPYLPADRQDVGNEDDGCEDLLDDDTERDLEDEEAYEQYLQHTYDLPQD